MQIKETKLKDLSKLRLREQCKINESAKVQTSLSPYDWNTSISHIVIS